MNHIKTANAPHNKDRAQFVDITNSIFSPTTRFPSKLKVQQSCYITETSTNTTTSRFTDRREGGGEVIVHKSQKLPPTHGMYESFRAKQNKKTNNCCYFPPVSAVVNNVQVFERFSAVCAFVPFWIGSFLIYCNVWCRQTRLYWQT